MLLQLREIRRVLAANVGVIVEYQDVCLSDFSPDTRLGSDLRAYAKKYSRKVWRKCFLRTNVQLAF